MNTITIEVKRTLSKYKDVKRLWDTLKERYALVNGPRIQQLKSEIARCEQPKSMSVASNYGKLTTLWEELHHHEPIITCSCCSNSTVGSFTFTQSSYQLAIQDEQVRIVSEVKDKKLAVIGFALCSSGRGCGQIEKVDKSHLLCTHCKKIGHEVSNCFEKISYPEWWEEQIKQSSGAGCGRLSNSSLQSAGRNRGVQ
ncbi:hypothetical protein PVK06_016795 [Gossypium arboreum]|uniref:Uncharacterized protein n=1 Tax=Gossypium arboreum TaxID=29729 RepID=A0ABR0Q1P7_GOSAR|nr:hypothetical protein PVK06_016795 [Gossypium arboreum]